MIGNQIYLTDCTESTIISQFATDTYVVFTGTTNSWNAGPGMPLLLHCFLQFLPTASTAACLLHLPELHDPNTPSSL
jgi:hypothetical protein